MTRDADDSDESNLIVRSWRRCIETHGLSPDKPKNVPIVAEGRLREHRERADEFLSVARSGLEQLYTQIADHGYVVLLCDDRGITIDVRGGWRGKKELSGRNPFKLGAYWHESYLGTCAVGTCIEEQVPLVCHQEEHFSTDFVGLTCTAAPIRAPSGMPMAILDVSAPRAPGNKSSQYFAAKLVELYARMIEDAFFFRHFRDHYILRLSGSREMVHMSSHHLVALDQAGAIAGANTGGRHLIGNGPPAARNAHGLDPLDITQILDCSLDDVMSIPFAVEDQVRAFRTRADGTLKFATVVEPRRPAKPPGSKLNKGSDAIAVPALDALASDDPDMRETIRFAKRLRNERVNILILGETGSGKEILARALHESSARATREFVPVNCAAIPESLIESELFGYAPGAFTGANRSGMNGLIKQADGGTLFLDEIGDMPLNLQTRLLRVLSEGEILPVGAKRSIKVDVRVVAATHQNVRAQIDRGHFRSDLFYRINGASLSIPALRSRADVEHVIRATFESLCQQRDEQRTLRGDAMSALLAYHWPGNIRELRNVLEFALATSDRSDITVAELPDECVAFEHGDDTSEDFTQSTERADQTLERLLQKTQWNISEVARTLNISRPTVYRRMRRWGIVAPNKQV